MTTYSEGGWPRPANAHLATRVRLYLLVPALAGALLASTALAQGVEERSPLAVTVTRPNLEEGIPGVAATVIDATKIATTPAQSVPALLAQEPGVQFRDLFGGPGARTFVDIRGFGATAAQNTLVLVNGRRLNDFDNAGVEFINVPKDSIRRIEVLRGNSAAVLYGDGAVGGAVNIIARPAAGNNGTTLRGATGSFLLKEGGVATSRSSRDTAISFDANAMSQKGWRENNELEQAGAGIELRRFTDRGEWYGTFATDTQHLGLPGARRFDLSGGENIVNIAPRGATTPTDFADQLGNRAVLGLSKLLPGGGELAVDGGLRVKQQDSIVISASGPAFDQVTNTRLATYSFTPRVRWEPEGSALRGITGLDYYYSDYNQVSRQGTGEVPVHRYDLKQHSLGVYGQGSMPIARATEGSAGLRLQYVSFTGGDIIDPDYVTSFGGDPFDGHRGSQRINQAQWAGHLGLERTLNPQTSVFGRLGRAFRMPTVDERVLSSATYDSFDLSTQVSWDAELGARRRIGNATVRGSAFVMQLKNEIVFNSTTFLNENIDPTQRAGLEAGADIPLAERWNLGLAATWLQAKFREGQFAGKAVPLVAPWTGSANVRWEFTRDWFFSGTMTAVGPRRMENDEDNEGPKIPAHALFDARFATQQGAWTFAAQVNNLLDRDYFTYAVQSTSNTQIYNAYPLPGRSWRVEAGVKF